MKITIAMSDIAVAKEVFERLENIRKARGLSQEELVENLGISRPTYARIQKGTCNFVTFISVLRELNLLEGLDLLVPAPSLRPSEVAKARVSRSHRYFTDLNVTDVGPYQSADKNHRKKNVLALVGSKKNGRMSVKEMLANRNNEGKK